MLLARHSIPTRRSSDLVVVLDDPREDGPSSGPGAADSDHADEDAHPTTVVEYPLPPAPPLAAMLGKGVLHPETARAVIGEAAMGLEVRSEEHTSELQSRGHIVCRHLLA